MSNIESDHGRTTPYEYMILENRKQTFDEMSMQDQRDELLAGVGLLIEWCSEVGPIVSKYGSTYPLMVQTIREMGTRYGPWVR